MEDSDEYDSEDYSDVEYYYYDIDDLKNALEDKVYSWREITNVLFKYSDDHVSHRLLAKFIKFSNPEEYKKIKYETYKHLRQFK